MNDLNLLDIAVKKGYINNFQKHEIVKKFENAQEKISLGSFLLKQRILNTKQLQELLSSVQEQKATLVQSKELDALFEKSNTSKGIEANIRVGSQIGPFVLQKLLGTGGMGAVYLAKQKSPEREVALKIMTKMQTSKKIQTQRFLQEVELTSQFDHPHIVKTYLAGVENDIPYLAMECIDGIPLEEYIQKHTPSIKEKLHIIYLTAKALHYAHQKGIIHRDIKPSNIMITSQKIPVLMDFGIAKSNRVRDKRLTTTGEVIGTPMYMAPEQIKGVRDLDARADVYSLGSVMYEIVTGRSLFPGETGLGLLYKSMSAIPIMPREIVDIPAQLEAIIVKSLEKKREKRYASALELANDIEKYLQGASVKAFNKYKLRQTRLKMIQYKKFFITTSLLFAAVATFCLFYFLRPKTVNDMNDQEKIELLTKLHKKKKRYKDYILALKLCKKLRLYDKAIWLSQEAMRKYPQKENFFSKKIKQSMVEMKENEKIAFLAKLEDRKEQFQDYELSFEIIDQFRFYKKGIHICEEGRKNFVKKHDFFTRKKAHYLFRIKDFFLAEKNYSLLKNKDDRDLFFQAKCLYYLKWYEKAVKLFSKIAPKKLVPKEQEDFYFYFGASLTLECFKSIDEFEYLRKIKHGKFAQEKLKKARDIFQQIKQENKKLDLYLGYCHIGDLKKAEQYFSAYKTSLGEKYKKNILLLKGLGILYFCKGKYKKSIEQFAYCSRLIPWESFYFHLTAQVYAAFPKIDIDKFYTQCAKALKREPHNVNPIYTLTSSLFATKEFTKIFRLYSFFVNFIKTEQFQIKPNLWEKQGFEISSQYLREANINTAKNALENPDILLRFYLSNNVSGKKFSESIFVAASNKTELIKYLQKKKKEYAGKREEIEQLLKKIRNSQKKENEKLLRSLIARFVMGHNVEVLDELELRENIRILQRILLDKKEKVLVRYWAAIILSKVRESNALHFLLRLCGSKRVDVKLLSMAALSSSGFTQELIDDLGYIRSKFSKELSIEVLTKQNRKVLALFLHNSGKHLKEKILQYLLHDKSQTIKIIAAKNLLEVAFHYSGVRSNLFVYKKQALSFLAKKFDSPNPTIRAYAFYWFRIENFDTLDTFYTMIQKNKFEEVYKSEELRVLSKYKQKLLNSLKKERNYKVKAAITYALKNYRIYERLETILIKLAAYNRRNKKFERVRLYSKHILRLRSYTQNIGEQLFLDLNKERNKVVRLHIVNTLSYLNQIELILKYVFADKNTGFNRLFPFGIASLRLGYSTGDKMHIFQGLSSNLKDIRNSLKKLGPIIVFSIGRLGRQDIKIPNQAKFILYAFIVEPLRKALNLKDSLTRMVAGYSSIMVENDDGMLLKHLIERYQNEKNKEVKVCILTSILHMAEKYNPKAFQKYSKIVESSTQDIKKTASYGHYYHVDKWSIYEWLTHWVSGVNRAERNEIKIQYLQRIYHSIMTNQYFYHRDRILTRLKILDQNWPNMKAARIYNTVFIFKKKVLEQFEKMKKYKTRYPIFWNFLDNERKKITKIAVTSKVESNYWTIREHYKKLLTISIFFKIIKQLDKAIHIYPSSYYLYTKAYFLHIMGYTQESVPILDSAIQATKKEEKDEQEENTILYLYTKIKYLIKLGKYKKAYIHLQTISKKDMSWGKLSYLRALALIHLNKKRKKDRIWKKALKDLYTCYISEPYSATPIIQMAHIYLFQKNLKKAEECIKLARKLIEQEDRRLVVLAQSTDGYAANTIRNLLYEKSLVYLCEARFYIQKKQIKEARFAIREGATFCKRPRINKIAVPLFNYYRSPFTQNNLKKYPEFRKYPRLIQHLPKSIHLFYDKR